MWVHEIYHQIKKEAFCKENFVWLYDGQIKMRLIWNAFIKVYFYISFFMIVSHPYFLLICCQNSASSYTDTVNWSKLHNTSMYWHLIWFDMIWYAMMWCDVMWYDMWYDMTWHDMTWRDAMRCDTMRYSIYKLRYTIYDTICYYIWYDIWYGMIWHDIIWYDMIYVKVCYYDIMIWYHIYIWYSIYIIYDITWCDTTWYDGKICSLILYHTLSIKTLTFRLRYQIFRAFHNVHQRTKRVTLG